MLTGPDRFSRIVAHSETIAAPCGSSSDGRRSLGCAGGYLEGRMRETGPAATFWLEARRI